MVDIETLKADPVVKKWLATVSEWTAYNYLRRFTSFYDWLQENGGDLAGLSPSELVDYQDEQNGRKAYHIIDLALMWANEQGGRHSTIKANVSTIRSFFKANHVPVPELNIERASKPTKPPVAGKLDVEDVKRVIDKSNELYRAVILTVFQGGLDASGVEYFSNNGYPSYREQVDRGDKVIIIDLPGRKAARFKTNFYSMINGDAADAIEHYIKAVRGHVGEGESLFLTEKRTPLTAKTLGRYWRRKVYELGIAEYDAPKCEKCGGKTTRIRAKAGEPAKYECRRCGWSVPASEFNGDKGHRTGVGFHELRDTFRTVWSKSPAQNTVAEWMMGHKLDKYDYDKAATDIDWMKDEYLKVAPFLNILSSDRAFGKVDEDEVDQLRKRVAELEKVKIEDVIVETGERYDAEIHKLQDQIKTQAERMDWLLTQVADLRISLEHPERYQELKEVKAKEDRERMEKLGFIFDKDGFIIGRERAAGEAA